jgi:hypothetical protein
VSQYSISLLPVLSVARGFGAGEFVLLHDNVKRNRNEKRKAKILSMK